jgi:hypothetical protein
MRFGLAPAVAMVAVLALAATGCGGSPLAAGNPAGPAPRPATEQAPNAGRIRDLVPLTTAQAARQAKRIALVVSLGSRVMEGAPGTPFTRTTFVAQKVLKGELPRRFVLQVVGGRIGKVVVDSPVRAFAKAHRYVLFLGPDGPAGPTIFPQAIHPVGRRDPHRLLERIRRYL